MSDTLASLRQALDGRYDPVRELGRGGMATVYLARDLRHGRDVAVKVLRPELAASLAASRFLKEIEIAARLNHPHIVPLLDSGNVNGVLFFVMPFVEGRSVRDLLNGDQRISLQTALQITGEVADALSYAHRKGLVHRDIKPENILLSEGHAVVADFGIAKAISTAGGEELTRTGFPIGTLGYMSPEQAAGRTDLDETTDVYGLASVCYEMMVGQAPGMWVTDEAQRYERFVDALPAHREKLDLLPGRVEAAIVHAMRMQPGERYTTPDAFAAALRRAVSERAPVAPDDVRDIIRHASEQQLAHPTEDGALSMGAVERIGAEVGLSPDRIRDAARAVASPPPAPMRWGGFLGAPSKVDLERTIAGEVPTQEFESLLEEVRAATGEVGRINETLGRSLSWNSLSFQNTLEGTGRLIHVMITPKAGTTRIRITESAGVQPTFTVLGMVIGGGVLAALLTEAVGTIVGAGPSLLAIPVFLGAWGAVSLGIRATFRGYMKRRVRILTSLLDRLTRHITDTTSPALPAGTVQPDTDP